MMKEEELLRNLTMMVKETQAGHLSWELQCQTTENADEETKPVEELEGKNWTVDECFLSFHCIFQEKDFLMITYEKIYSCGEGKRSTNLIFLPPLGIRFFNLDVLAPYAVQAGQMLVYEVHMLWTSIVEQRSKHPELISIKR